MSASAVPVKFEAEQEIRLALVLYGGVSLAIYMNGVIRELFELVRATTPDASNNNLFVENIDGAGRVYRTLGRMLGSNAVRLEELNDDAPVRTRFVIDVISGTSAGGINGIVLAKALANQQKIETLPKLWLDQADIASLINDRSSLIDGRENLQDRGVMLNIPEALLNGQRLYVKVLDALRAMDDDPVTNPSLYVDELDLFVTTTDLDGLPLPIRLANDAVVERRYKNVFHFVYAKEAASGEARNDFAKVNNPFLAFAARSTSSFPFAFEPMRLEDIKPIDPYYGNAQKFNGDVDTWQKLFKPYSPENFPQRNFGDGGYLNNKPFSYATDTLLRRRANLRTYRKLLYVEPSPEELTGTGSAAKPDAISNVVKALVTLPGYETIRQDIERVHERNRLIERVRSITDDVDRDVRQGAPRPANPATGDRYGNSDLANMIRIKGVAYGGYHRLKVSAVTDELAALIARIAHVEEDSQDFQAIRDLIGAWRRKRYTDFFKSAAPQPSEQSENRFLIDLDLSYRLRRINFLRTKIDELYGLDIEEFREKAQLVCSNPALTTVLDGDQSEIDAFRQELRAIKGSLNATFVYLRRVGRDLRAGRDEGRKLQALVDEAKESIPLKKILGIQTSEGRKKEAENLLKNDAIGSKFDAIASALIAAIRPAAEKAAAECMAALANDSQLVPSVSVARSWIRHYYDYYDDYDMITFPIIYGTDAGEATAVDIIRVSPRDANSLLNEKDPGAPGKLAGATLFHFGGFLDPLWRRNDMLWGRLDGAECIIKMMLPDSEQDATQLVRAAHQAVLDQELAGAAADDPYRAVVLKLRERLGDPRAPAPDIAREHPPDRERMVLNVARATTVVGDVLDNIAQQRGTPGHQAAAWLARAGSLLWGLVEISVPHSWAHLVFRHWLTLLYLFEAFLIIGGLVFNAAAVEKLGLLTLGVTVAFSLGVVLTGEFLRGQRRWLRRLLVVLGLVLLILAAIGAVHLVTLARQAISSFGLGGTI